PRLRSGHRRGEREAEDTDDQREAAHGGREGSPHARSAPVTAQRSDAKGAPQVASRTTISAASPLHTPTIPQPGSSASSAIVMYTATEKSIPHIRKRVSPAPIRIPSSANTAPLAGISSAKIHQISWAWAITASSLVNV